MVAHEEEARGKREAQEKREGEDEEDSTDVTGEGQERPGRDPRTYRSLRIRRHSREFHCPVLVVGENGNDLMEHQGSQSL